MKESLPQRYEPQTRIEVFSRLHSRFEVDVSEVNGLENLLSFSKEAPLIIASDHLTDITIETVIAEAAKYKKIGVAAQSTHLEIPVGGRLMKWAANERIYPISTHKDTAMSRQALHRFRLADYERMAAEMLNGISIVTAAHRPSYSGTLPDHPGLAAVTLHQLTGAPIVPVAVDIQLDSEMDPVHDFIGTVKRLAIHKRPKAHISFGEPMIFPPIEKEMLDLLEKLYNLSLPVEQKEEGEIALSKVLQQGGDIMYALASLLPPEKRGIWE